MAKITCAYSKCNIKFEPTREWHIYHHPKCRKKAFDERHGISKLSDIEKRVKRLEAISENKGIQNPDKG